MHYYHLKYWNRFIRLAFKGLQLDIFVDQSQYTANTQDAGIRVVIHDQGIMPFPDEQGFSVPTGLSTIVGIRKVSYVKNMLVKENKIWGLRFRVIFPIYVPLIFL